METIINNEKEYSRRNYFNDMIDLRKVFVGYGRWLEQRNICGQGSIENYEEYLIEGKIIENENVINSFIGRLKTGEYKVILYNGQSPILKDNMGFADLIICDLNEDSTVELIDNDVIIIHTDRETIKLKGYKDMSDFEIIARKYLDQCEGTLVIKDNEMQTEFTEDNFIDIEKEKYYDKCKDIVDIDIFVGDESDSVWRMNWDAIVVTYRNNYEELWQRP